MIVHRDGKWCVVSKDGSRDFGCFTTEAEARRRLGQVEFFKQQASALKGNRLTREAIAKLCPGCGEEMARRNLTEIDFAALAESDAFLEQFNQGMCDAFAPAEGFRTRCMETLTGQAGVQDAGALCNALKQFCGFPLSAATRESDRKVARAGRFLEAKGEKGKTWRVIPIEAGASKNTVVDPATGEEKPRVYTAEALKAAVEAGLFEGLPALALEFLGPDGRSTFFDHTPEGLEPNSLTKNTIGVFHNATWNEAEERVEADFTFIDPVMQDRNWRAFEATGQTLFAFSIDGEGSGEFTEGAFEVRLISTLKTTDGVSRPAAGGRFLRLAASVMREAGRVQTMKWRRLLASALKPLNLKSEAAKRIVSESEKDTLKEAEAVELLQALISDPEVAQWKTMLEELLAAVMQMRQQQQATPPAAPPPPAPVPPAAPPPAGLTASDVEKMLADQEQRRTVESFVADAIRERKIPENAAALIRESVAAKPSDLEHAKASVEKVSEAIGTNGWPEPQVKVTKDAAEKQAELIGKAIDGALSGRIVENVRPLRSISRMVSLATGLIDPPADLKMAFFNHAVREGIIRYNEASIGRDIDPTALGRSSRMAESRKVNLFGALRGRFGLRESVDTTTFVNLFADRLHKRLLAMVDRPQVTDFMAIVSDQGEVPDFRTQREQQPGKYPLIDDVAEGDPFQPIATPGDRSVNWTVTKAGNTEDVTWESILADDLRVATRVSEELLAAALETRRKTFWEKLLTNAVVDDGLPLYDAAHNNTGAVPFSFDALTTVRGRMRKQTPFGGADHELGAANLPRFIVAVTELEDAVRKVIKSQTRPEDNQPAGVDNLHRGLQEIILDHHTDAIFWSAVADPSRVATARVGFIPGYRNPRLFVQDMENVGTFFDEDKVTYKVKDAWGCTILDFRSFDRGNG